MLLLINGLEYYLYYVSLTKRMPIAYLHNLFHVKIVLS